MFLECILLAAGYSREMPGGVPALMELMLGAPRNKLTHGSINAEWAVCRRKTGREGQSLEWPTHTVRGTGGGQPHLLGENLRFGLTVRPVPPVT